MLDRSGRGLRLTSAGLVFLEHAKRLWAECLAAMRPAGQLRVGQAGLLRVGVTGATVDGVAMPAMRRLLPRAIALISRQGTAWSPLMQEFRRAILDCAAGMG